MRSVPNSRAGTSHPDGTPLRAARRDLELEQLATRLPRGYAFPRLIVHHTMSHPPFMRLQGNI
eukprot:7246880-Pyramimonas_sp.AAC.1